MTKPNLYNQGQSLIVIVVILFILTGLTLAGVYFYLDKQLTDISTISEAPSGEKLIEPKEETSPALEEELAKEEEEKEEEEEEEEEEKIIPEEITPPEEKPAEEPIIQKCFDGTLYGQCSGTKPKYCENGNLIEKCSLCGCSSGLICKNNICVNKEKNSVALFVDENTYQALSNEIVRFRLDIERDSGINVFIFHDNWSRAKEIRDELIDLREIGIKGAVLIGDIPITYQITEYQGRRYPPTPSDYYYQKLDQKDWFEETADTIVQTIDQKSNYSRTIWTSRLMAPGNNFNQKIELLKNYFDRNHKYRIGQLSYSGMLFLESQNQSNISEELNSTVSQIAEYTSLYKESSKVETAYAFDPGERKNRILEKLTKNYEIISFNIHGSPTSQWVGGSYYINKEDVLNHPPGALFISIESCSNGDITNSDYIAGWYLFSGKSLLVKANSVETFYIGWGSLDSLIEYKLVATGIDFGEIYKNCTGGQQSFLFGDPTLSIRKKDFENGPKLAIDKSIIDLGNISINDLKDKDVLKSIKIKNNGKSKLILTCYSFGYRWMDRSLEEEDDPGGVLQIEPIAETKTISPGESINISIVAQDKKYIVPGKYQQFETYITNDPSNPYLKIDLNCTWYK